MNSSVSGKKHSTTAQLARLTEYITHGFNFHKHTGLVLLDLEKAYDTVWVSGLLNKLIQYKFPGYLLHFLKSYLTDRTFAVTVAGFLSTQKTLQAGLPQGAVLSPIIFTIYTSDFPRNPFVQTAMYANDTALFTQSWRPDTISRRLSQAISRITAYFNGGLK
jgi:hypothetical protein